MILNGIVSSDSRVITHDSNVPKNSSVNGHVDEWQSNVRVILYRQLEAWRQSRRPID